MRKYIFDVIRTCIVSVIAVAAYSHETKKSEEEYFNQCKAIGIEAGIAEFEALNSPRKECDGKDQNERLQIREWRTVKQSFDACIS